jgi:putative MATE family efflux protein
MPPKSIGVNVFDESKPMWWLLLAFIIPLLMGYVMQLATLTAEGMFVGHLIGITALAATSVVFTLDTLLISFLVGIATGSTILIGQAFGAGDRARVKKVAGTTLGTALYLGIIAAVAGYWLCAPLLESLATPAEILAPATAYAKVLFLASPFWFPYLVYTTFLRGTGDSKTPFKVLLITTVISIALMPPLMLGLFGFPRLGIVGGVVANQIGMLVAFGWFLWHLRRTQNSLQFDRETLSDMWVDWKILWLILKIGIPSGVQAILSSLAAIAVLTFVNRFGAHAAAAYGAVNRIVSYVQFSALSISAAASIFTAQCIGARRPEMLGRVVRSALGLSYLITGTLIVAGYALSWYILTAFITDAGTRRLAHELLTITLWSYIVFGNSSVLTGVMRGSGDVLIPTLIGIVAIWGVEVPTAYVLMHHYGIDGIWMAYPAEFCFGLASQLVYYEIIWKRKKHNALV